MLKSLKQKLNNALHDNSGASLLELIIAVTILAIVTAPLLNTFVISAKLNAKARTMGLETNAATSIYEKIKGSNASDIVSSEEDGSVKKEQTEKLGKLFGADSVAVTPTVQTSKDGLYKQETRAVDIDLTGVSSGVEPGDRSFDAKVNLTAIPTGSDGLVTFSQYDNDYVTSDNDTARTVQMSFNNVWMQPTEKNGDPDQRISSHLPEQITTDPLKEGKRITKDPDDKGQKIIKQQRLITISFNTSTASDGKVTVTPVITYEYDLRWRELVKQGEEEKLVEKKIYSQSHSEARPADSEDQAVYKKQLKDFTYIDAGKTEADHHFFDVMIFYRPYYDAYATDNGYKESVTIENESNLKGDIFIVKEKADDTRDYSGLVRLIENHPQEKNRFNLRVHTNMGLRQSDDMLKKQSLSGGTFRFMKVYNSAGYYNLTENLKDTDEKYSATTLLKQEAIDHIYKVKIELYESGGLTAGKSPVVKLNGIKVN